MRLHCANYSNIHKLTPTGLQGQPQTVNDLRLHSSLGQSPLALPNSKCLVLNATGCLRSKAYIYGYFALIAREPLTCVVFLAGNNNPQAYPSVRKWAEGCRAAGRSWRIPLSPVWASALCHTWRCACPRVQSALPNTGNQTSLYVVKESTMRIHLQIRQVPFHSTMKEGDTKRSGSLAPHHLGNHKLRNAVKLHQIKYANDYWTLTRCPPSNVNVYSNTTETAFIYLLHLYPMFFYSGNPKWLTFSPSPFCHYNNPARGVRLEFTNSW